MKKSKLFLGVDGGGTRTTAVVVDENGNILTRCCGDSINYYAVGLDKARVSMKKIMAKISEDYGIDSFSSAFIGMSALNGRANEKELKGFVEGVIKSEKIQMDSDLFIALESLAVEGECAVAISGTGSMAISRAKDGTTECIGGWGHILGDEGSGYKIALDAIKAAIHSYEGTLPETELVEAVLNFYEIEKMEDLIDLFYNPLIEKKRVAAFAIKVKELAQSGDKTAQEIILKNADDFSKTVLSLLKNYSKTIKIGLWGGIFTHLSLYSERFKNNLEKNGYANIGVLEYPPEIGAVFSAMKLYGLDVNDKAMENMGDNTEEKA
ncbi:MAG TPA: BadF/BadG/BcrA/BcrD ATPase family protein [Clostridia bacterium]|nr:BadF/BadG/BcrA/BcrD ATPase family protein [Clostridia bacterium]